MERINIHENGLYLVLEVNDREEVKLMHFSALPFEERDIHTDSGTDPFTLMQIRLTGVNQTGEHHGPKYSLTHPGMDMKLKELRDYRNAFGRKLEIITKDEPSGLRAEAHIQFYDGVGMIRSWTELQNEGEQELGIEYVSSFAYLGIEKEGLLSYEDKLKIGILHNAWQRELVWGSYTLEELGMPVAQPERIRRSSKTLSVENTGNWSTKAYIPMGTVENTETGSLLFWQIEHNGSWQWEISDQDGHLYLNLSGPNEHHAHWWKSLKPGERFVSVKAGVGSVIGGLDEAGAELTRYRRKIRRPNTDNEKMPVIFNDYMNCLWGDPTTEKELPMVDKAAQAGCEYYVIDAGWYSDGFWWDGVGEWLPSEKRFPGGLKVLTDYIRSKGMIPGAWLELEVMGIKCPKAASLPDDWFFMRHGKRVIDRSRYQLDFRNPAVRAHASEVIDRLVHAYGIGYIKMDYNIEPGIGTDVNCDSFGDGLLSHQRAYLSWLDEIFETYPELVIENCSSGGMRMDYAMLSRHSIQSTSDQENYVRYASITANSPLALTPEQAAVWSYPLTEGDREEVIFNMVNAMLLRIHQSGHLVNLGPERFDLVKEAIGCYGRIRGEIRQAVPFWPLGLAGYRDPWVCLGLRAGGKDFIAVWRRDSKEDCVQLPIPARKGKGMKASRLYPEEALGECRWNAQSGILTVRLPERVSARLFCLEAV